MKHSLLFFLGLSLIFFIFIFLMPRKAHEAIPPTFCATDKQAGNSLACVGTHPSYCDSDPSAANILSCVGVRPDYCFADESSADSLACINARPSYCQTKPELSNALACTGSAPSYCQMDKKYANDLACVGVRPPSCQSDKELANSLICLGAGPSYCHSTPPQYADSLACASFTGLYVLDLLKNGKYKVPAEIQKILSSNETKDILFFQKLREMAGLF
ncbi:MAG: hypothetical protein ACXWRE_09655 [Pseudobdellovibrionaceae bacterium]